MKNIRTVPDFAYWLGVVLALLAPASVTATEPAARTQTTMQVTPAPDTTPTTAAPSWARCGQWWQLALDVGWPSDQLATVDRVMYRESRCREDATHLNANGSVDRGLMQVNSIHLPWLAAYGITAADLTTAGGGLTGALLLWQRSGWGPWRV